MTTLIMMVGLVASGKSTCAKELSTKYNAIIHSSDELRKELFEDENNQDKNEELFQELHRRIKQDLSEGKNVIYDATNINYKRRMAFLDELKKFNIFKKCCLVATPYEDCLKQNSLRDRKVPEHVIKKMYKNAFIPQYYEGWDDIEIIWNIKREYNYIDLFDELDLIPQDNPHHTLTIGEHCRKCYENIDCYSSDTLKRAAMFHDIGKVFTKGFKNAKGEDSEIAHYYNHHNVSAYMSLFYLNWLDEVDLLETVNYIQWHMQPFFIETEKAKNKFVNLVGNDFYNNLMILHEADKSAR